MSCGTLTASMSDAVIAGLDEVGRGALAGPVVAAACVLPKEILAKLRKRVCIDDSKKLTPEQRQESCALITRLCAFGVGVVEPAIIDELGILEATERAMHRALRQLQSILRPTYLLIDGRDKFWFDLPHSSVIRGDSLEPCISASSIIAKVVRDRIMERSDPVFPGYSFAVHKGYGTEGHRESLRRLKPCPIHRRSFLAP